MKKTAAIICMILCCYSLNAQKVQPVLKQSGKLTISVDPRTELLGAIQLLSGYKLATTGTPYSNEVSDFFKPFAGLKAVTLTDSLYNNGFSYDAPPAFMFYLSQPDGLKKTKPYSDYLVRRANGENQLDNYASAISDFAKTAGFQKFWNSKIGLYDKIVNLTNNEIANIDLVPIIENYFNEKQNSYHIVVCPLFGRNNYGSSIKNSNGKYDIYSFTSANNQKDGIPYITRNNLVYLVLHEFSHSFVNPLSEQYIETVNRSQELFKPVENQMKNMAYSNWETCLNEHIIRAVGIRLTEKSEGTKQADAAFARELGMGFIYTEPILESLKKFEKERDTKNITFSEYYPTLLAALQDIKPGFNGNINNVLTSPRLAIIYPTGGSDRNVMAKTKEYVSAIAGFIGKKQNKECLVLSDSEALKTPLSGYGILCYGTVGSNRFLSHYRASLPFSIENNVLIADKNYNDENLRFITCIPNPQDSNSGMTVYTAIKDESIPAINNLFHGMSDYHIFDGKGNELSRGYYSKSGSPWKFKKEQ